MVAVETIGQKLKIETTRNAVIYSWPENPDRETREEDFQAWKTDFLMRLKRTKKFWVVHNGTARLSAKQRWQMGEVLEQRSGLVSLQIQGVVFVKATRAVRGVLTAISWVKGQPPFPTYFVETLNEALEHTQEE